MTDGERAGGFCFLLVEASRQYGRTGLTYCTVVGCSGQEQSHMQKEAGRGQGYYLRGSKRKIVAGILRPSDTQPELREIANDARQIRRLFERLKREGPVAACYEAGVSGYDLHRQITGLGVAWPPNPNTGSVPVDPTPPPGPSPDPP